jgi:hypothetical protein
MAYCRDLTCRYACIDAVAKSFVRRALAVPPRYVHLEVVFDSEEVIYELLGAGYVIATAELSDEFSQG